MSLPRDVSVRIHKLNCMFLASSFIIGGNFIDHLCSTPNVKCHIICNKNLLKQIYCIKWNEVLLMLSECCSFPAALKSHASKYHHNYY